MSSWKSKLAGLAPQLKTHAEKACQEQMTKVSQEPDLKPGASHTGYPVADSPHPEPSYQRHQAEVGISDLADRCYC